MIEYLPEGPRNLSLIPLHQINLILALGMRRHKDPKSVVNLSCEVGLRPVWTA